MRKTLLTTFCLLAAGSAFAADINKATLADLDGLKGVGPDTSRRIMAERQKGEFKDWKDLMGRVKGIGAARAASLSKQGLTVNGTGYQAVKAEGKEAAAPAKPSAAAQKK